MKCHDLMRHLRMFTRVLGATSVSMEKKTCVFQDAMNKLNPMLLDSDVIVFATPIYYWNFPAQLKTVIDRFQVTVFSMRGKKAVLLATAASKESWVKGALDMEQQFTAFKPLAHRPKPMLAKP